MRTDSAFLFSYRILLNDRQVGPFDRRTIVGMRTKKLLGNNVALLRSDGLALTVAQLMMDRLEKADIHGGVLDPVGGPISGSWPTFTVHFGGSWRGAGALGYIGKGELRFQGDVLRLSGRRKGSLFSTKPERVKLHTNTLASAHASVKDRCVLELVFKPGQPASLTRGQQTAQLRLDDIDAVNELLLLMQMGE
jgi:hypothetical protein